MKTQSRIEKLEKAAALRLPPKESKPLKIYQRNVDLAGNGTWEGGRVPIAGENNLTLIVVQTKPDE